MAREEDLTKVTQFPKTLLLSWSIPPAPSGSGIIVGNLARQFRSKEMVVLGAYYLGAPPVQWDDRWPKLRYATVQPPSGFRGARWLRWAQWPWLLLRAWWILTTERCEAILVVYPDDRYLLAGYVLARLARKPLYGYFHNTYMEQRKNSRLAQWLQPRVFALARHLFVLSAAMEALYREGYPALSCSSLVHSFNEPLPEPNGVTPPSVHWPTRLTLFGNINASNAEAVTRIAKLVQTMSDVHLTLLSGTERSYLRKLGFDGERVSMETVSRDVLLKRLRQSDIVLLPHGFDSSMAMEEIATIFPTRTIEALISQRPILAHLPANCFLCSFLRAHAAALIVDKPDIAALREAVECLRRDSELRVTLVRQALTAAKQFEAPVVAAHLREVMREQSTADTKRQPPSAGIPKWIKEISQAV